MRGPTHLLQLVFILAFMVFLTAQGHPRPSLKSSQPTISQPAAPASWPTLAEVISLDSKIKPSASLIDMLNSNSDRNKRVVASADATTEPSADDSSSKIPAATVIDVADFGITDIGWNEDNIKFNYITVNDLRRLIEKAGAKLDHSLYAQSATHVASLSHEDKIKHGFITTQKWTAKPTTVAETTPMTSTTTTQSTSTTTQSTSSVTTVASIISEAPQTTQLTTLVKKVATRALNLTTSTTPYPPLTLSLGAWQITEEDLPIYVGSAAGVLLLIIVLLGVTTWRCCAVPTSRQPASNSSSPEKSPCKELESSNRGGSSNNNGLSHHLSRAESPPQNGLDLQGTSHDSMVVCLSGTRVESRIVSSPGHAKVATLTQRRATPFDANSSSPVVDNSTYVRVPPVDNFLISTSNGATTFHTFQPNNSNSSGKNSTSSSPDECCGFVSTTGNKGSSLSTPGTARSTPSSEALDVVADLRYEAARFRSLPHRPNESNGNDNFLEELGLDPGPKSRVIPMKHLQPSSSLNGNSTSHNIEDLYAKVNLNAKKNRDGIVVVGGQVAVVQPFKNCSGSVMTTFVSPKSSMMTSSAIVTSFDDTDLDEQFSSSDSSTFYNMKTSL